jgi:uncharacterized membrane protein
MGARGLGRVGAGPVLGGARCAVTLWSIQATVGEGFTFHLLGVTAFTLVVGPALALLGTGVALGLLIAVRGGLGLNAGIAFVTMAAVPVAATWAIHVTARRRLAPNFFIYIFVGAFFGAAAAYAAAGIAGAVVLALGAGVASPLVFGEYMPYLIYLAFGEATLTGMSMTLLVVYRPQWVATFDDAHYLDDRDA